MGHKTKRCARNFSLQALLEARQQLRFAWIVTPLKGMSSSLRASIVLATLFRTSNPSPKTSGNFLHPLALLKLRTQQKAVGISSLSGIFTEGCFPLPSHIEAILLSFPHKQLFLTSKATHLHLFLSIPAWKRRNQHTKGTTDLLRGRDFRCCYNRSSQETSCPRPLLRGADIIYGVTESISR